MVRATAADLDTIDFAVFIEEIPSIRCYVKKVCLRGNIDKSILERILTCLPRLTHLSIRGYPNSTQHTPYTNRLFKLKYFFLHFLTSYSFGAPYDQNQIDHDGGDGDDVNRGLMPHSQSRDYTEARALLGILSLFTHIGELYVQLSSEPGFEWTLPETDFLTLIPEPGILSVHSFNIDGFSVTASTFVFFHRLLKLASLQSFTVSSAGYPTFTPCRDILLDSPNLKYFAIYVCIGGYYQVDVWDMGLERSLLIQPSYATSGFLHHDDAEQYIYDWIGIKAVLQLGAFTIRHLSIQISHHPISVFHIMQCLEYIEWSWLEDYLLEHYLNLETITFHYECRYDTLHNESNEEAIQSYIKEHLPGLHERGLIRFSSPVPGLKEIDPIKVDYSLFRK